MNKTVNKLKFKLMISLNPFKIFSTLVFTHTWNLIFHREVIISDLNKFETDYEVVIEEKLAIGITCTKKEKEICFLLELHLKMFARSPTDTLVMFAQVENVVYLSI